jgi:hypothetical protein
MNISQRIMENKIVGAFVYESYTPAKCGVVIEDLGHDGQYFHTLKVKFIKGEVRQVNSGNLRDFEDLIAEHKKKYEGHMAKLELLKQL